MSRFLFQRFLLLIPTLLGVLLVTFLLLYVARRVNGKFNEATPPNVPQPLIGLGRAAVDPSEHL